MARRRGPRAGSVAVVIILVLIIIAAVVAVRGLPARAASIALATAYQESGIRNLDHGDRDSVGLFQQRPSQGWGTVEQIQNPVYASNRFYDALVKIDNWQTGDINDVAQAVQRSGFPEAYRDHEADGRVLASVLTGYSDAALQCLDRSDADSDAVALTRLLNRRFDAANARRDARTITITARTERLAWAYAHFAVANAGSYGLATVQVGERRWTADARRLAEWTTVDATPAPGPRRVVLTVGS